MGKIIPEAPSSFDGSLEELYDRWAKHVLLDPIIVEEFHLQFCAYYLESKDPLFLERMVRDQKRSQTMQTKYGQLRPTDNSPTWWIHYQLFSGQFRQFRSFDSLIESIPCHMFDVRIPVNISIAGWHVAHIFDAKDRNIDFNSWDRKELLRRTARNIHPCNYFYIPKADWQRHGGDPTVIAFFYEKFKSRYQSIWEDFLKLVDGKAPLTSIDSSEYKYSIQVIQKEPCYEPTGRENLPTDLLTKPDSITRMGDNVVQKYKFSRLCFRADMIEPLDWDDTFCVITPKGCFAMTKREFYKAFLNVVESVSYRQNGIYHYSKTPQKALRFRRDCSDK